jgi:hypothetical protein
MLKTMAGTETEVCRMMCTTRSSCNILHQPTPRNISSYCSTVIIHLVLTKQPPLHPQSGLDLLLVDVEFSDSRDIALEHLEHLSGPNPNAAVS